MNGKIIHIGLVIAVAGIGYLFGLSFPIGMHVFLGLLVIVLYIVNPPLGLTIVAIFIPLNLRIPQEYSQLIGIDSLTLLELLVPVILLLFFISSVWIMDRKTFKRLVPVYLLFFVGVLCLTVVKAQHKFEFFSQMAKWFMYLAGFLLYSFHFREQRWQQNLVKTLVFTGSILVLVTAVPYVFQLEISRTSQFEIRLPSMLGELRRFSSTYYQPNHLGAYLGFLLSLQFGTIFAAKRYRMLPISTWSFPVIIGTGFILTLSRGAWIAFAVTLLAGLAITRKNTRVYRILLIIVFIAFLSQIALPSELLPARLRDMLNLESSDLLARMSLWRGAWDMFRNNPLLGVGVGNFGPLYWHFWERDMLYVEAQWAVSAHNMYLQILATSGILGFIAFSLLLLHFFKKSYNLVKLHMNSDAFGLYLGLFLAFIFFCCHGFVDNYYSYIPSYLPFIITLALIQTAKPNQKSATETQ